MQHCPICKNDVPESQRYPRYLCPTCSQRAVAADGRALAIGNSMTSKPIRWLNPETGMVEDQRSFTIGPIRASDAETGQVRDDIERIDYAFRCYVDGKPCAAGEAYFGGVVIEAL